MYKKSKIYGFFIEFKAAFDSINSDALSYKINNLGVSFQFMRVINKDIYSETYLAVWGKEGTSESFETITSVRQGCQISPLTFTLYLDDLTEWLDWGVRLPGLKLKTLLYTDDVVLLAEHPAALQIMINQVVKYCSLGNLDFSKIQDHNQFIQIKKNGSTKGKNMG